VVVPLPDLLGRKQILEIHGSTVKMGPDVDLERVARGTPMFSGADLAAIINEAAILATMANKAHVELADLEEARDKVRFGRARTSRKVEEEERVATAYHEAGHARRRTATASPAATCSTRSRSCAAGGSPRSARPTTSPPAPPWTSSRPPSSPGT
jgi:cell division protease FtsH